MAYLAFLGFIFSLYALSELGSVKKRLAALEKKDPAP